jgi:hypothetical protein
MYVLDCTTRVYSLPGMHGSFWLEAMSGHHAHSLLSVRVFFPRSTKTFSLLPFISTLYLGFNAHAKECLEAHSFTFFNVYHTV